MNLHDEIQAAFGNIHAPEDAVERMKQELYQKDFHEGEDAITCRVEQAPKRSFWRYPMYVAAALAICTACGLSIWSLRDNQTGFHPSTTIPVPATTETTESDLSAEQEANKLFEEMEANRKAEAEAKMQS